MFEAAFCNLFFEGAGLDTTFALNVSKSLVPAMMYVVPELLGSNKLWTPSGLLYGCWNPKLQENRL